MSEVSADGLVLDGPGLRVIAARPDFAATVGESLSVVIRPDVIEMNAVDGADAFGNDLSGTVEDVRFAGSVVHYTVKTERHDWQVSVGAIRSQIVPPGTKVRAALAPRGLRGDAYGQVEGLDVTGSQRPGRRRARQGHQQLEPEEKGNKRDGRDRH